MEARQNPDRERAVPVSPAKVSTPTLARHTICRPRLLPDDDAAEQVLLAVITAPAGYGKTAAAVQLASMLDPNPCWFTIEAADNDIALFLAHICAALRLPPTSCAEISSALNDPQRGVAFAIDVLRVAIEQLPERVVLVLDDFHKLTNPEILAMLTKWLVVPPERFTMLCVGRTPPRLPLQRTRTHGRLFELRSEQLAFTLNEVSETFALAFADDAPTAELARTIFDTTEGWPSAVYLAGLAATSLAPSDRTRTIDDATIMRWREVDEYLRAVIPVTVDEADRAFLTQTSVLDELDPELCDAVAQTANSATTLHRLVETEKFIACSSAPEPLFRCHGLVRRFLREQLALNDAERHTALYHRAADWYANNDQLAHAIRCATATNDVRLGQMLVAQSWRSATAIENFDAVSEWAEVVGPDGTAHGSVCAVLAWGSLAAYDETNMRRWLARADTLAAGRQTGITVTIGKHLALAHWASVNGDVTSMLAHVQQATDVITLHQDAKVKQPGITLVRNVATCMHGIGQLLNDDLEEASRLLTSAVEETRGDHDDHTLVTALSHLGLLEALNGDHERALVYADEVDQRTAASPRNRPLPALNRLTHSLASLLRNDPADAEDHVAAALALCNDSYHPIERGIMFIQWARLHHRRGNLPEARKALRLARSCARTASPSLLDRLVRSAENELRFIGLGSNDQLPPGARELTEREIEILHILPEPLSRSEIAEQLHISENTVKTHLTAISRKLGVRGRSAIVERARELVLLAD